MSFPSSASIPYLTLCNFGSAPPSKNQKLLLFVPSQKSSRRLLPWLFSYFISVDSGQLSAVTESPPLSPLFFSSSIHLHLLSPFLPLPFQHITSCRVNWLPAYPSSLLHHFLDSDSLTLLYTRPLLNRQDLLLYLSSLIFHFYRHVRQVDSRG